MRGVWSGKRPRTRPCKTLIFNIIRRCVTASGETWVKLSRLIGPELIVFNPKMTIFMQINREIKK